MRYNYKNVWSSEMILVVRSMTVGLRENGIFIAKIQEACILMLIWKQFTLVFIF